MRWAMSWPAPDSPRPDLTPDLTWAIREAATILVQLFAPMMPHLAEACWGVLGSRVWFQKRVGPKSNEICWLKRR